MVRIFKIFIFCFLSFSFISNAQTKDIWAHGSVYVLSKSLKKHKALKEVFVSNGDTIVRTNKKGEFRIPVKEGQVVFPILPSGYGYANPKKWWFNISNDLAENSEVEIDFSLQKLKEKKAFKFLAIGDIQVGENEELLQATQSILKELINRDDYDFSIYLGDLVNDSPELFLPLKQLIDDVNQPSWVVYGNHDRNFEVEKENQPNLFRENFGSENYAFYRNDVLFVSLNSITPEGKYGYKNNYLPNQLKFLTQLVAKLKPTQPIVISQHIPLVAMQNKDSIIEILNNFKNVLFLTGHTHNVFQNEIKMPSGNTIYELTAGAVCGNWWTGQNDWEGIPVSLMSCGTPKGYFEIDFNNENYKINYKGVNLPSSKQFSIWFGDYDSTPLEPLSDSNEFYINVFSGSNNTQVSVKLSNGDVVYLKRERIVDPFVNYIKKTQKEETAPDKNSEKSAYLRYKSQHIWKGTFSNDLESGYHKIEVLIKSPKTAPIKESSWFYKK